MPSDPKPLRRVRLSRKDWGLLWRLVVVGKRCRLCGVRAETAHHIVPRSQGGDDVAENLMEVCGDGIRGCHGAIESMDIQARRDVRHSLAGAEREYIQRKKGLVWLDKRYPE